MGIPFDIYDHLGMENYDGGNEAWNYDHDEEFNLFEENSRRAYDQVMFENLYGDIYNPDNTEDDEFNCDDLDCNDCAEDW